MYLTGCSQNELKQTHDELKEQFPDQVRKFQGDLSNTTTIAGMLKAINNENGNLDIFVANIGSGRSQMECHG